MHKPRQTGFGVTVVASLLCAACGHPPEVKTMAGLVTKHTANLREATTELAASFNSDRKTAEQSLVSEEVEIRNSVEQTQHVVGVWELAKNKEALELLNGTRANDSVILKDPFSAIGFTRRLRPKAEPEFASVEPRTKELETVIKKIDPLRNDRSTEQIIGLLKIYGAAFADGLDKQSGEIEKLTDSANKINEAAEGSEN